MFLRSERGTEKFRGPCRRCRFRSSWPPMSETITARTRFSTETAAKTQRRRRHNGFSCYLSSTTAGQEQARAGPVELLRRNLAHFITAASCGQSPGGIFRANNDRRIHVNRVFCISPLRFGMRELNSAPSACIVTFRDFTMAETLFEQVGGEAKLREIIGVFIDRVFEDRMIGFFFRNADRARIKEMEYQLTAQFLGAPVEYTGRRLDLAHAKHPIMGEK